MDTEYAELFFKERQNILNDTEQFLDKVLSFLKFAKSSLGGRIDTDRLGNVDSILKSLCFIHGFYLFPANNACETVSTLKVDKDAIKKLIHGMKFGDVYPKVLESNFWEEVDEYETLDKLPREPAHLFLELTRDIYRKSPQHAHRLAKKYLESLPNENRLKPAVWAKGKTDHSLFGVSVGVRHHVRPIFLYVKLHLLKLYSSNNSSLSKTTALGWVERGYFDKSSKYDNRIKPCPSCCVFFNKLLDNPSKPGSFGPFGNCAEYDVIHTTNLAFTLKNSAIEWTMFKSACECAFDTYKKMSSFCAFTSSRVKDYLATMKDTAKVLQFKGSELKAGNYELKAQDWWEFKRANK